MAPDQTQDTQKSDPPKWAVVATLVVFGAIAILLFTCIVGILTDDRPWYHRGQPLYDVTISEWGDARERDKVATAANLMYGYIADRTSTEVEFWFDNMERFPDESQQRAYALIYALDELAEDPERREAQVGPTAMLLMHGMYPQMEDDILEVIRLARSLEEQQEDRER